MVSAATCCAAKCPLFARSCRPGRREPDDASPFAINPAHPGRVTPLSALLTPRRPLPRCQDSEPCSRASCGLTGAAQRADSWSADKSKPAWYGGWNGFRKRQDQDRFPRPRNLQFEHTVWCSNEGTHERGSASLRMISGKRLASPESRVLVAMEPAVVHVRGRRRPSRLSWASAFWQDQNHCRAGCMVMSPVAGH